MQNSEGSFRWARSQIEPVRFTPTYSRYLGWKRVSSPRKSKFGQQEPCCMWFPKPIRYWQPMGIESKRKTSMTPPNVAVAMNNTTMHDAHPPPTVQWGKLSLQNPLLIDGTWPSRNTGHNPSYAEKRCSRLKEISMAHQECETSRRLVEPWKAVRLHQAWVVLATCDELVGAH